MYNLVSDKTKTVALFINDYNPVFEVALEKLSKKLGRPLRGVILVDSGVKEKGINIPDPSGSFETIVCDFNDITSLSNAINGLRQQLLLMSAGSERNQPYVKLVLPYVPYIYGPSESSLDWATHKDTMRKLLRSYDSTLAPKSDIVLHDSEAEIGRVLRDMQFPMIIKPNGLAASVLVKRANNEAEMRETLNDVFKVLKDIYKRDSGRGEPSIIIEEFIEGGMYSIDAYVNQHGDIWCLPCVKVTTADSIGIEGFYSYRNDTRHGLTHTETEAAQLAAKKAIYALGLRSCVSHIELFKTANGWKIIELGPRPGGYRQDMYGLAYGTDHAYNELLIKVGLEPEILVKQKAYSAIFNMYADEEGTITAIEGLEEAQKLPSIFRITTHNVVGDEAVFCGNGGKFVIDGVLSNDSYEALDADMAKLRSVLKIRTARI